MAVLSNPINDDNIISRFEDYVKQAANSGVVWGTDNKPFPEFPDDTFGGTTGGKITEITPSSFNQIVTADDIFNVLLAETNRYTRVRNLRAIKHMSGVGNIYDATAKAHLNSSYDQAVAPSQVISSGQEISMVGLETQLNEFRTAYNLAQANTVTIQINVCHSSCHSSCHGSRSRR